MSTTALVKFHANARQPFRVRVSPLEFVRLAKELGARIDITPGANGESEQSMTLFVPVRYVVGIDPDMPEDAPARFEAP